VAIRLLTTSSSFSLGSLKLPSSSLSLGVSTFSANLDNSWDFSCNRSRARVSPVRSGSSVVFVILFLTSSKAVPAPVPLKSGSLNSLPSSAAYLAKSLYNTLLDITKKTYKYVRLLQQDSLGHHPLTLGSIRNEIVAFKGHLTDCFQSHLCHLLIFVCLVVAKIRSSRVYFLSGTTGLVPRIVLK